MASAKNDSALKKFYGVAVEYCDFVDGLKSWRPRHFYLNLQSLLAKLLYTILFVQIDEFYYRLPNEKTNDEKYNAKHSDYKRTAKKMERMFLKDLHRVVQYHKENKDEEAAYRASIVSNDLAELYQDVRKGIVAFEEASKEGRAVASWEWRFNYEIHWGEHLLRAITTVYEILYDPLPD